MTTKAKPLSADEHERLIVWAERILFACKGMDDTFMRGVWPLPQIAATITSQSERIRELEEAIYVVRIELAALVADPEQANFLGVVKNEADADCLKRAYDAATAVLKKEK